jgi:vitamin B12 transporter
LSADLNASARRFDSSDEANGSRMAGYALLGASVQYRIDHIWSLELSGRNLGNRDYELARGYNTPQRTVYLHLKAAAF